MLGLREDEVKFHEIVLFFSFSARCSLKYISIIEIETDIFINLTQIVICDGVHPFFLRNAGK